MKEAKQEAVTVYQVFSGEGVGDLEITPAAAAIARYLGIDLSPEGKAARYKKGLNVIVTGPPLSGKSFQAKVSEGGSD